MSFILDALKKSENERQRRIGPSLADVQIRRRPGHRPWWAAAVAALLLVNLGVLIAVLTRTPKAPTSPDAAGPASVASAPAPTYTPAPQSQVTQPARAPTAPAATYKPEVRSLADEADALADASAGAYPPELESAAAVPEGPPLVRQISPGAAAPAVAATNSAPPRETSNEVLPTTTDLLASGTQVPELHLDIHVNSPNPAERFVFINMRKYVEGQTLSEGPQLERITADGAVLNQRGLRFLLPRQ